MKAVIVYNQAAGSAARRFKDLQAAVERLRAGGWDVEVLDTSFEGHAAELARNAAAAGAEVVIAAGGDGTVNEVVQGLAHGNAALGVLPVGTVNVWSKEAGFSASIVEAAGQLLESKRVMLDLGKAGDRYFLLMASVGLDAEVTASVGQASRQKQQFGILPYILQTVQMLPRYRGAEIEIDLDGDVHHHDALMVLASNTRLYGGIGRPAPNAIANDGMLDIRVFHGKGPVHSVRHIANFLLRRGSENADIIRARRLRVQANPPLAVQVDGDPIGTTPIEITIEPKALPVLVPPTYDTSLIRPEHE